VVSWKTCFCFLVVTVYFSAVTVCFSVVTVCFLVVTVCFLAVTRVACSVVSWKTCVCFVVVMWRWCCRVCLADVCPGRQGWTVCPIVSGKAKRQDVSFF